MNLPETARALGWHLGRAVLIIAAIAVIVAVGSLLLLTTAYALVGYGSWWPPVGLLAGAVLVAGLVTWWRAGMVRP